jgi:predicted Zn-ribbon and HTH transcriptional regulator
MPLSHQFIICKACGSTFSVDSKIKNPPTLCPKCEKVKNVLANDKR